RETHCAHEDERSGERPTHARRTIASRHARPDLRADARIGAGTAKLVDVLLVEAHDDVNVAVAHRAELRLVRLLDLAVHARRELREALELLLRLLRGDAPTARAVGALNALSGQLRLDADRDTLRLPLPLHDDLAL